MLLDFTLKANIHCFSLTPNFKKNKIIQSQHITYVYTCSQHGNLCLKKSRFQETLFVTYSVDSFLLPEHFYSTYLCRTDQVYQTHTLLFLQSSLTGQMHCFGKVIKLNVQACIKESCLLKPCPLTLHTLCFLCLGRQGTHNGLLHIIAFQLVPVPLLIPSEPLEVYNMRKKTSSDVSEGRWETAENYCRLQKQICQQLSHISCCTIPMKSDNCGTAEVNTAWYHRTAEEKLYGVLGI